MLFSKKIFVFIAAAAACIIVSAMLLRFTPYPEWEKFTEGPFSPVLTDRNGLELRVVPLENGLRRIYTPLEDYPPYLPAVFTAGEDKRFYRHIGVDPAALLRAVYQNIRAGYVVSGASTVSMQLASLTSPEPATMTAKLKEMTNALRIEARSSKEQLLELWLSSLPFGSNIQGAAAAGRHFFGVEPEELSLEQSLLLSVIPRRPELYNPAKNPAAAVEAAYALSINAGIDVSRAELSAAAKKAFGSKDSPDEYRWPFNAPHFVNLVASGLSSDAYRPGPSVRTSLDLKINDILHGALASKVETAERYRISNGAGLIIDVQTGEVLGYVGSVDFYDDAHSGQIDGVQILRQPGSTLKPFLYSMALESGYSASSILPDIPMSFGHEEVYIPQNYNQRYNGPVRLRTALSSSLNIPAVYLTEKLGVDRFINLLLSLKFDSLEAQKQTLGAGLALGNAEISLFELVRAYAVFPRGGISVQTRMMLSDEGAIISENSDEQIFKTSTTRLIEDILSDNVNRILGFGRRGIGTDGFDAMMKTGTSNQFNNIWAVGATPEIVCGIWMGNFSGETVIGSPGSGLPADSVVEVLSKLQNGKRFGPMEGLHEVEICPLSGGAVTENCPSSMKEWFRAGEEPKPCSYHLKNDAVTEINYPVEYRNWAHIYGVDFKASKEERPLRITNPSDGAVFFYDSSMPFQSQAVTIEVEGSGAGSLYVNEQKVFTDLLPFRWFLPMKRGVYRIRAEADDLKSEITIDLK